MPRVLLLATTTGYQTRAFGEAAERLGVDLVFATDRCTMLEDPWQDSALPIRFYDEPGSAAAILDAAATHPFDGVLAVGDRPTVIAALVMERLGLPGHSPDAAAAARHKLCTRERLRDAGLLVPWFAEYPITADCSSLALSLSFPCVVKPVALSGSRGVMRANDATQLADAFTRLRAMLEAPDIRAERNEAHGRVLVEGFIPGREYAIEGLRDHGALHVLALFDKPDPLDGPFFEETIYVTPSRAPAELQEAIAAAVKSAASALGLLHGPIHAECRANESGVFILEVAARPIGGLCARALRFQRAGCAPHETAASDTPPSPPEASVLISLEELLLRHAIGEWSAGWDREPPASGVMMIPIPRRGIFRRAEGVEEARATPLVTDVRITAKADQVLVPLPEGASYLGFIFARGQSPQGVEQALRAAHGRLAFAIDPEVRVLQSING
jgi:ATP-grasp domain-containing protein/L-aminoacid ligase-like protein